MSWGTAESTPPTAMASERPVLTLETVVPLLRSDLVVRRGSAPGLLEVGATSGKRLVLHEFEVSVARMLDGRRRVADLIENADRLGIPVDSDGLTQFVRQLEQLDFLAPPGTPPHSRTQPARQRRVWDEATRSCFQSGVKLVRQGRPDEAAPFFRKILGDDPENPEAHEMLALIAAGHSLAARPIGEIFERTGTPAPRRSRTLLYAAVAAGLSVAGQLFIPGLLGDSAKVVTPAAPAPVPVPKLPAVPAMPPAPATPSHWTLPVDRRWHPTLAEVRAPVTGQLSWREPLPSRVDKGERLGELRTAAEPEAPAPKDSARIAQLEKLAAQDPVYQEFLEKERAALARPPPSGKVSGLVAPARGQLTPLASAAASVSEGEVVARIVDSEQWHLKVRVPEAVAPDSPCQVAGDGVADLAPCRLVASRPEGVEVELTVSVAASAAPWLGLSRSAYVRLPTAPEKP